MRQRNPRFIIVGGVLLAMAAVFFFFMLSIAGKSTDPAALMSAVGTVCGVVGGLALTMMVVGSIGRKASPSHLA